MHYRSSIEAGEKVVRPIENVMKVHNIPQWESYSSESRITAMIYSRLDQIVDTCRNDGASWQAYSMLRNELHDKGAPE